MNRIPLKLKHRTGKEYKGIKRMKSNHNPGKRFKLKPTHYKSREIPDKSKSNPQTPPGTPRGKCIKGSALRKSRFVCRCGGCGV